MKTDEQEKLNDNPLPWAVGRSGLTIVDANGKRVFEFENNHFIVLACNHFEKMREMIEFMASHYRVPVDIREKANHFLVELDKVDANV